MTLPSLPAGYFPFPASPTPASPVVEPPAPPVAFPMGWLLRHGSGPLACRAMRDLGEVPSDVAEKLRLVPYTSLAGWQLLLSQDSDGTWSGGMLSTPEGARLKGVGTIPAYRRLIELGWDPETPGLAATRRLLFRLLAEDNDPSVMGELMPKHHDDDLILRGRLMLREAAAAALATAGLETDPRLRGAARRLVERVGAYLRSPLSQKPWVRVGNQHVLAAEASPPSFHLLVMLAHMPKFRSEHHDFIGRLYDYLAQPWPRQSIVQHVGSHVLEQPHLVLGDFLPTRNAMDADMPSSLAWLETTARLGFLKRNENWTRLLDRLLDDRDRHGVWHPPRSVEMPKHVPAWSWPTLPLSDAKDGATALSVDVTFRLGLIAKLAGREISLV